MKNEIIDIIDDQKNNNNYEELEQDNINEELIIKKKKSKKKQNKFINSTFFKFIIISIILIPVIYIIYFLLNDNISIKSIEKQYENNNKLQNNKLNDINFKLVHIINNTNDYTKNNTKKKKFPIESVSQFPSGDIITADWVSLDIYDNLYNIKQKIKVFDIIDERNHFKEQKKVYKIEIKDENNFAIYANDGSLKIYQKKDGNFLLKQNIEDEEIIDVIYDEKSNIITCSRDHEIKIFDKSDKEVYKRNKTITFAYSFHVKLMGDLLIGTELKTIDFYNVTKKYQLITSINEKSVHEFEQFGNDKIIVYHNDTLKIISTKEYKLIDTIAIGFQAYGIKYIKDKEIVLVGGCYKYNKLWDKSVLSIYKSDTFELIKSIDDIHDSCVKGISMLKNGLFGTYGDDYDNGYPIKIWSLE